MFLFVFGGGHLETKNTCLGLQLGSFSLSHFRISFSLSHSLSLSQVELAGDVQFAEVLDVASALTPVPGGVGPMTIAMLLVNVLRAAKFSIQD